MKKNYKLIQFLKTVKKFNTLSKYGEALEKIFNKKSVKSLINSLNKQKIITDEDIFNEKFEPKNYVKNISYKESNNEKSLLEYNYEDYLQRQREISEQNKKKKIKIEPWSINEKTPRLPITKISFDSYKYNPKYNMIYKRIPSFSFIKSAKSVTKIDENIKIEPKIELKIKPIKKGNIKNKKLNKLLNIKTQTNIKIKNNKYLPFLTSINSNIIKIKKNTVIKNEKKNNSYENKKRYINKSMTSKKNKNLSNFEPFFKSGNTTVNYKKMISRNNKNSIYEYISKTPSVWFYSPKYDYIEPHSRQILFNPPRYKDKKNYKNNRIMKRIVTSFNFSREYKSIDKPKLRKKSKSQYY